MMMNMCSFLGVRKLRPKMTWMLFLEIFVLSLLGVSLTLNMYFASLKYTSPTFVTSMVNTVASITFVIAIALRMEIVDLRSARGLAKVAGTAVSFAGVTTMTLYKGAAIASPWRAPVHIPSGGDAAHNAWLKGSLLAVASCVCWSVWYIMQATSVKRYPAELSLTAWMATVGGVQSLAFAVLLQHERQDWLIGFGLKFWCIIYSGLACSGFTVFAQLWCTEKKGPVFVTMFNPVSTIMVAILAYFIFGENLYVGRYVVVHACGACLPLLSSTKSVLHSGMARQPGHNMRMSARALLRACVHQLCVSHQPNYCC
uniref:WAT1-related protein n=1 Tax=Aegilops tauschii subsp. strangulata TaxID=200361 RepID=A0A453J181_AEGTS